MNTFLSEFLKGMVRHTVTTAGGAATAAGWLEGDQTQTIVGAISIVIGLIFSALDKKKKEN